MDFGTALGHLKAGNRMTRTGWNGKGQWIRRVDLYADKEFSVQELEPCEGTWLPFLVIKTVDQKLVPWLASQTDLLAEDWAFHADLE